MPSSKAFKAMTCVVEDQVFTHFSAFTAGIAQTVVNICLTIRFLESGVSAVALIFVD
jgi:hypothetical protein